MGMRILVLGGDGYLGWPTALHLSQAGHEVAVADNFVRRHYDDELGVESLVPIEPLRTRIAVWQELTGFAIQAVIGHPLIVYGPGNQTAASSTSGTPSGVSSWPARTRLTGASSGCSTR